MKLHGITRDGDTWKAPDGTVVRKRSKRLKIAIERPRFRYLGETRFTKGFSMRKEINGVSERFPLGVDVDNACRLADEIGAFLSLPENTLEDARKRFNLRSSGKRTQCATIGEVFGRHTMARSSLDISPATARGYRSSLIHILRITQAHRAGKVLRYRRGVPLNWTPWLGISTTELNASLVLDFQQAMVANSSADEEDALSAKISCDTHVRQARSVFSKSALLFYRHSGLSLPDLSDFFSVPYFGKKKFFELLPFETMERIFLSSLGLKESDPNAWRAFMLCTHLGLRKSEASAAQWSWVQEADGRPTMALRERGSFKPKLGHGRRVEFEPWVWQELRAARVSIDTILDGTDLAGTFNRLNAWLRELGADVAKPTHELRKMWISYTAKTKGLLAAAQQGGHKDINTTRDFYADSRFPESLLRFWEGKR